MVYGKAPRAGTRELPIFKNRDAKRAPCGYYESTHVSIQGTFGFEIKIDDNYRVC